MQKFDLSALSKQNNYTLMVLFITVFATILGVGIVVPMMPIYAKSMGASGTWLGIMFSAFSFARLIFMPIVGRSSDKFGRKAFILWGLIIYLLVSVGYIAASNILQLTAVRFLNGIGSAMVIPIAMAYAGDLAPAGKEGTYMGVLNTGLFLGLGTGPLIGGVLTDLWGMEAAFYGLLALVALAMIPTIFMLPNRSKSLKKKQAKPAPWKKIITNKTVIGIGIYRFISSLGRGTIMAFLPLLATEHGISAGQIGMIISINILLTGILQVPFGRVADRYNKPILMIVGSIIFSVAFGLLPLGNSFLSLMTISAGMGIAGAVSMPAASAIVVESGSLLGMGSVMSIFNMAMSLGLIISPLISGAVMDIANLDTAFFIGAGISMLGSIALFPLIKNYRNQLAEGA